MAQNFFCPAWCNPAIVIISRSLSCEHSLMSEHPFSSMQSFQQAYTGGLSTREAYAQLAQHDIKRELSQLALAAQ